MLLRTKPQPLEFRISNHGGREWNHHSKRKNPFDPSSLLLLTHLVDPSTECEEKSINFGANTEESESVWKSFHSTPEPATVEKVHGLTISNQVGSLFWELSKVCFKFRYMGCSTRVRGAPTWQQDQPIFSSESMETRRNCRFLSSLLRAYWGCVVIVVCLCERCCLHKAVFFCAYILFYYASQRFKPQQMALAAATVVKTKVKPSGNRWWNSSTLG